MKNMSQLEMSGLIEVCNSITFYIALFYFDNDRCILFFSVPDDRIFRWQNI